jgi:hypothetical protein
MTRELWLVGFDVIIDNKTLVKSGSIYFDLRHNNDIDNIQSSWANLRDQILNNWGLKQAQCDVKITNATKLGSDIVFLQNDQNAELPSDSQIIEEKPTDDKEVLT